MAEYTVWVMDKAYSKVLFLGDWTDLSYSQRLNGVGTANVSVRGNYSGIADMDITDASANDRLRRLLILRSGSVVFGGTIEMAEWKIPEEAPKDENFSIHAVDLGEYLNMRLVIPNAGSATYNVTATSDDAIKNLVRYHAAACAAAARQFSDLSVAADTSSASTFEVSERNKILLNAVNDIASRDRVYWRMTPNASGATFETGFPYYGVDRSVAQSANDQCVFSLDRHNIAEANWMRDRSGVANFLYVGGQDSGSARTIIEREDTTSSACLLRRERFVDARHLSASESLVAYGNAALEERSPQEEFYTKPLASTWVATTGTHWGLGDRVTMRIVTHRTYEKAAVITGIDVSVTQNGTESVRPILEVV